MFAYFPEYDSQKAYTHQEVVELVVQQRQWLSMLAISSARKRCVLRVDFCDYNDEEDSVAVYLLSKQEVNVYSLVAGKLFKRTYRTSSVKQGIIIIYAMPTIDGWFVMDVDEGETSSGKVVDFGFMSSDGFGV